MKPPIDIGFMKTEYVRTYSSSPSTSHFHPWSLPHPSLSCPQFVLLCKLVWYIKCEKWFSIRTNTSRYSSSASLQELAPWNFQAMLFHKNQHLQRNFKNLSIRKGFVCVRTWKPSGMGGMLGLEYAHFSTIQISLFIP